MLITRIPAKDTAREHHFSPVILFFSEETREVEDESDKALTEDRQGHCQGGTNCRDRIVVEGKDEETEDASEVHVPVTLLSFGTQLPVLPQDHHQER